MKFITAIYFTEDKKQKVVYEFNPGVDAVNASNFSKLAADNYPMDAKATYKTFELGAKNLL